MGPGKLKFALAPVAWRFLRWGVRLDGPDARAFTSQGPVIFACLHRDILPAILFVRSVRPVLLVSNSEDGEILIRALGNEDYRFARGQTGREGARALVELRRRVQAGSSVGVAVDGPKGPFGAVQPGAIRLASLVGVPVVPVRAEPTRGLHLNTWDRTLVPAPFAPVRILVGDPLYIESEAPETELLEMQRRLETFFGVQPMSGSDA